MPPCQELLNFQAKSHDLGENVPKFGMSQNPVSPCLLFSLFFDLFLFSGKIILGRSELQMLNLGENHPSGNPDFGQNEPKKTCPRVPQQAPSAGCFANLPRKSSTTSFTMELWSLLEGDVGVAHLAGNFVPWTAI